jgi:DNA polymerase III delta prime subunit
MNNMLDIIKTQMLLNQKDNMLYGFIILMIFETLSANIKDFIIFLKTLFTNYFNSKILNNISLKPIFKTEITFERNFIKNDNWDKADAILAHVLNIPNVNQLVIAQLEIVNTKNIVEVNNDILFQLSNIEHNIKGCNIDSVTFKLMSKNLNTLELNDFINRITENYLISKKNNLGNKLYYFDHIVEKTISRTPIIPKLMFSKHLFDSNRRLDNVYHTRQEEINHRVRFFLNNKEWYDKRGIPHTLGLMLYGSPGTGKTSTIKAIANESKRHIINVNLSAIKTKKQLKKLFYDEKLDICENSDNTSITNTYIIPINKRVYVIEDVDSMKDNFLLKRNTSSIELPDDPDELNEEKKLHDIDLSTILNIIDGTLETPGRILIITSNYPERIDEAFIRPGRIDLCIEYGKCTIEVVCKMYRDFYQLDIPLDKINLIENNKWSPAELSQLLFKNFNNPINALEDIITLVPNQYFKFRLKESEESEESQNNFKILDETVTNEDINKTNNDLNNKENKILDEPVLSNKETTKNSEDTFELDVYNKFDAYEYHELLKNIENVDINDPTYIDIVKKYISDYIPKFQYHNKLYENQLISSVIKNSSYDGYNTEYIIVYKSYHLDYSTNKNHDKRSIIITSDNNVFLQEFDKLNIPNGVFYINQNIDNGYGYATLDTIPEELDNNYSSLYEKNSYATLDSMLEEQSITVSNS